MTRGLVVLLLATAAPAAPDALKLYRKELKRLDQAEERYWEGYFKRRVEADRVRLEPYYDMIRAMNEGKKGMNTDLAVDLSRYADLYEDFVKIERGRGHAASEFVRSGHQKAAARIFDALLETTNAIEELEPELWKNRVQGGWGSFDQRPGIRRHGLAIRRELLVAALARVPGYLVTRAWAVATRRDAKDSVRRRVAVLDALGASGAGLEVLVPALRSPLVAIRITALQNTKTLTDRQPLLQDPNVLVRRALLASLGTDPRWIQPVLEHYAGAVAQERVDSVGALGRLTGQRFGDDPERWRAWYVRHRDAIKAGKFDVTKAQLEIVKTREVSHPTKFYGIATASRGIVFVVDGGLPLLLPADYTLQRTKSFWDWVIGNPEWKRDYRRHKDVLEEEFAKALDQLHPDSRFGVITFSDGGKLKRVGERRMLKVTSRDLRAAKRFLAVHAPKGFRSSLANLVSTMEMAGLFPHDDHKIGGAQADTVYLFADGSMRGGRFLYPEAVLAAFDRFNRFRLLVVHTIRFSNGGSHSEQLMEGLAKRTGGTYKRFWKP
ncbi:MAG: HEAT repeat domain-containing protein [Planctomycetota bacterium]